MSLNLSAFHNFEACKETEGEVFLGHWRALSLQDPGNAAGALLSTHRANVSLLGAEDWARIEAEVATMDADRVRPALVRHWCATHTGPAIVPVWLSTLEWDVQLALHLYRERADLQRAVLSEEDLSRLLQSRHAEVRELGLRLHGQGAVVAQPLSEKARRRG